MVADVGAVSSAEGWDWAAPLALARPLFDVLPALLAVATTAQVEGGSPSVPSSGTGAVADLVDSAEYALWLTMDVLGAVLRRWGKGGSAAEKLYQGSRAGEDSEMVLTCVRENPSPQTRQGFRFGLVVCCLLLVFADGAVVFVSLMDRLQMQYPKSKMFVPPSLAVCVSSLALDYFLELACGIMWPRQAL